ncbi:hypothetical protein [Sciscionella sediminilitoris]|uniref:hypothetical protein n=1 Tax=Sciscionella sediminilitoris TaxID=1445613 RepID=UPI00068A5151|nr:hypothetical protein [Sciscionella sp. SE31]
MAGKRTWRVALAGALGFALFAGTSGMGWAADGAAAAGRSAVYGGGPFYSGGGKEMDVVRDSGFTTVILWSIHVDKDTGDLSFNDRKIIAGGEYVGDNPDWAAQLRTLKTAPTSVNRVEVSVGSAPPAQDWGAIEELLSSPDGTEKLRKNFAKLREVTGADAINDDDEQTYDADSTIRFARMAKEIGYQGFTIAPYTNTGHWKKVKDGLGSQLDRVYLQDYAGGAGNDPGQWGRDLGMPVDPGLWSKHGEGCAEGDSPDQVRDTMRGWHSSAGIPGGFLWLYDDIAKCAQQGRTAKDYARAVNEGTA